MSKSTVQTKPIKRTPKGEKKVKEILAAAKLIFIRDGHNNLTLTKLAKSLNIHKYNIQYYFNTRDDLIRELILNVANDSKDNTTKQLTSLNNLSADEKFAGYITYVIDNLADPIHHGFYTQLYALAASDELINSYVLEHYERIFSFMIPLVQEVMPELSKQECRSRVILVVSLLDGLGVVLSKEILKSKYKHLKALALTSIMQIIRQ